MKVSASVKNILVFSFLLETLCVTYALDVTVITPFTSVLYTVAGIAIATCFLFVSPRATVSSPSLFSFDLPGTRYKWVLLGITVLMMYHFTSIRIEDSPLDFHDADMLPIIKKMCERMMSGNWSTVYDPIPEIWGGIQPIYLPAMWMPFCLPIWLQIDLRWISALSLLIVFAITIWKTGYSHKQGFAILLSAFLLFGWLFTSERPGLITYTEEGLVILYYALLVIALNMRKAWLIGLCASLCVLSRYAMIGWLPVMIIYYCWQKEWKQLFSFAAAGVSCFIICILLPFGWETFARHIALPAEYISFTARVWHDTPVVFRESLGLAKFFGAGRIAELHYLLIVLSFLIPLLFLGLAILLQKRFSFAATNIPLATLKISLVIFYSFIDVPYLYLFYTSSFVSLIALAYLMREEVKGGSEW